MIVRPSLILVRKGGLREVAPRTQDGRWGEEIDNGSRAELVVGDGEDWEPLWYNKHAGIRTMNQEHGTIHGSAGIIICKMHFTVYCLIAYVTINIHYITITWKEYYGAIYPEHTIELGVIYLKQMSGCYFNRTSISKAGLLTLTARQQALQLTESMPTGDHPVH